MQRTLIKYYKITSMNESGEDAENGEDRENNDKMDVWRDTRAKS